MAIVTGAAGGLGRAFALDLAAAGAQVAVVTRKDLEGLKKTYEQIVSLGGKAMWIQADISKEEDDNRMALETRDAFGRVDILVNNAAIIPSRKAFNEIPPEEFEQVMNTNVKGTWMSARAVYPYMKAQGKGKIINIASEAFFTGSHGFAHYVASKGGIVGLTRALAAELGPANICVNVVSRTDNKLCGGFDTSLPTNKDMEVASVDRGIIEIIKELRIFGRGYGFFLRPAGSHHCGGVPYRKSGCQGAVVQANLGACLAEQVMGRASARALGGPESLGRAG